MSNKISNTRRVQCYIILNDTNKMYLRLLKEGKREQGYFNSLPFTPLARVKWLNKVTALPSNYNSLITAHKKSYPLTLI